jgi:hypothetical protein
MPQLDMDDHATRDCQLRFRVLRMTDMEEVLPQIKIRVNPQVSFTQGHKGRDMQDSRGSVVLKLEAIVSQERAEELVRRHVEPLVIESRKGHHVSLNRCGERRVLQHLTGLKLRRRHKPMLHEFSVDGPA